jgi:hypothetical protein
MSHRNPYWLTRAIVAVRTWLRALVVRNEMLIEAIDEHSISQAPTVLVCTACPAKMPPADADLSGRCRNCSTIWADMEFARMVQVEASKWPTADVLAELMADDDAQRPEPIATTAAPASTREYVLRKAAKCRTEKILKRQVTALILSGTDPGLIQDALTVFLDPDLLDEPRELVAV